MLNLTFGRFQIDNANTYQHYILKAQKYCYLFELQRLKNCYSVFAAQIDNKFKA